MLILTSDNHKKINVMKKKFILACALIGMGSLSFAQIKDDGTKVYTPEAGDWGLGANAAPVLGYFGNMFNGNTNNTIGNAFVGNQAIYGKYFISNTLAYRGSVRISALSNSQITLEDSSSTGTPDYYEDKTTNSGFGLYLSGGIEKRIGSNRLQGYYGGEAILSFGATTPNVENEWGITLDTASVNDGSALNDRVLSSKVGSTFGFGLRGFVGVEYFVIPKLSIGAEFGWGLMFNTTAGGEIVNENVDMTTNLVTDISYLTGKSSDFNLDTDNLGGAIRIMYHF
jgi:hypothetical protein